ncbi:MAG: hypothetical protein NVS4B1_02060 [Ktedonobacteraceae bacterium]
MLSGASQVAWNSSHTTSIVQTCARHKEQAGSIAEQASREAYILWQRIECVLVDTREQRVAYLLFHCGLTPHEIVQRCVGEFNDIQEVLSLRCAIMKKLISIVEYKENL